ncbi:MAG: hypothetical protein P8178_15815 [Candidatus Thiodiazotropha sp.]
MKDFVRGVMGKWFRLPFSAQPIMISCRILSVRNESGLVLRHGLVNVMPDVAALRVIRKLNGKCLDGKRVCVERYQGIPDES